MPEDDVSKNLPKILPVSTERMLQISLAVLALTLLDLIEGLWHIDIERRQHAWPGLDAELLDLRTIQIKILLAQRTHTHQLHLSLEDVNEHGQLVEPQLTEYGAPAGDPVIVLELASIVKGIVLVNISLQVLGIGIHRPELVHPEELASLADTVQLDDRSVGVGVATRGLSLPSDDAIAVMDVLLRDNLEAAIIESTKDLGTGKHLALLAVDEIVETTGQAHLGTDTMPETVEGVKDLGNRFGVFAEKLHTTFGRGVEGDD